MQGEYVTLCHFSDPQVRVEKSSTKFSSEAIRKWAYLPQSDNARVMRLMPVSRYAKYTCTD